MRWILLLYAQACFLHTPGYGQPRSGHLVYDIITCTIRDTSKVAKNDVESVLEFMGDDFKADVYFNPKWVVIVRKKPDGYKTIMYDRRQKIIYQYTTAPDKNVLSVDSLAILKTNDPVLLKTLDDVKAALGISEMTEESQLMFGWKVFRMTVQSMFNTNGIEDEIWKASFGDVPNLVYPDHLYFANYGLPLEITQDFDDIRFTWGVKKVLPLRNREVFQKPSGEYELRVFDAKALVQEVSGFLKEDAEKKQ